MRARRGERGLTLIELVVAMAIFALVAVMGLQSLTGMMRLRDRLDGTATRAETLGTALALLRADLGGALPMLFFPPGGVQPRSALEFDRTGDGALLALSRGGLPDPRAPGAVGIGRVEWRLDPATGALSRREWPVLTPAEEVAGPARTVLSGVTGLQLRSHWPEIGWVEGASQLGPSTAPETVSDSDVPVAANVYSGALPDAVELVLDTGETGAIRLLETLK